MQNSPIDVSDLSPAKLDLLEKLIREGGDDFNSFPLSFAQERLWFLHQLEPGPAYNLPAVIHLSGNLDHGALQEALNEIVRRHESLRTIFLPLNSGPVQVVLPTMELLLEVVDLRDFSDTERPAALTQHSAEEARTVFDLAKGPLLRAKLVRLQATEYVLLLTMHHIVCDGWSTGVFIRELSALYDAFTSGLSSPLPELPIQYPDFAVWQRERLQSDVLEPDLAYWKNQLADAPPVLDVPADRPRGAVSSLEGARFSFVLPQHLSEELQSLSKRHSVTLFMVLLAAWQTLLYRYSGQKDISVGSPIANRTETELEGLIGCFVNTLVLRTKLDGKLTFSELLERVRETCLAAYAHQDLPFEQLVEQLQSDRSMSYTPLFQVMLVLQNAPLPVLKLRGLSLNCVAGDTGTAKFDLMLSVESSEQALKCEIEYRTGLFNEETIARLASHLQQLLAGIVAAPETQLCVLPLLTAVEQEQLLFEWNETATEYATEHLLHRQIEAQVERTPGAVALVYEEEQLTYRELNERANQLAHYLQGRGVGPEVVVGLMVERSVEMMVGLLGILKAGGAYLPLDTGYPPERLSYMLAQAGVAVLLSQGRLSGQVPASEAAVVRLDQDWGEISGESVANPASVVGAENLAYVIYTSGSTGQPKGVMIPHRGICNRLFWMQQVFQLSAADRVLQKTPYSFDVSVWEFFWPLMTGACLVMARPGGHSDPGYLLELMGRERVTTLHFVPSMLEVFVETEGVGAGCAQVRQVMSSGEALPVELVRRYQEQVQARLYNLYGPTEASVDVTWWETEAGAERVPIGQPIANTQLYVLDEQMQPVPVGIAGELYIGGVGLARGYLRGAELTAARFVPHPYSEERGARLYRTGDIARYQSDGNLQYVGRIDEQVKLRGYRVELGEIENVLVQHAGVQEAVVLLREDKPGQQRLVAYLVATGDPVSRTTLNHYLAEKLPRHMVPAGYVFLERLPLMSNGKVDKRALPEPPSTLERDPHTYVAPRNIKEQALADIWQLLLGVSQVSVDDNFFEIGGNSLLMMQVIGQVKRVFDLNLPVAIFYQSPTIESLAEAIRKLQRSTLLEVGVSLTRGPQSVAAHSTIVPLQTLGAKPPFFCAHTLGGHLGDSLELAQELAVYEQPVYGLQARGLDDDSEPYTKIEEMVDSYLKAILSFQDRGPFRIGGYCSAGLVALEIARELRQLGHDVELLALIGTQAVPEGPISLDEMRRDPEVLPIVLFCGELKVTISEETLRSLSSNNRKEFVWEEFCRQLPEISTNLGRTMFERLYRVYVANAVALINNVAGPYEGRVALFEFTEHHNRLSQRSAWDELCTGSIERYEVPGNHITAMRRPSVKVLAQQLDACLNQPKKLSLKRNRRSIQKKKLAFEG